MVKYRFNRTVLEKADLVYSFQNGEVKFYSPSNDLCLWKCLASFAYPDPDNLGGCEDSKAIAYALAMDNAKEGMEGVGHTWIQATTVCRRLGINCMTLTTLMKTLA